MQTSATTVFNINQSSEKINPNNQSNIIRTHRGESHGQSLGIVKVDDLAIRNQLTEPQNILNIRKNDLIIDKRKAYSNADQILE